MKACKEIAPGKRATGKGLGEKKGNRISSSLVAERNEARRLSLKLTKGSARKLLRQACWMAFVICTLSTGCKQSTQMPPPEPPAVTVATPIHKEIVEWDEYTGRTQAVENVEIRPRVSGYIVQIRFKEGQIVKPGDVLFVIDPRLYQDVLDQAKANLQTTDAQRRLQEADFARAKRLFETNVTAAEQYETNLAERDKAVSQMAQAQASVNSAQLNVDFTQVKSPIEGRISRQLVTLGNLVQADSTELTTVVSVDPVYAYFNVDERTVQRLFHQIERGQLQNPLDSRIPVFLQLLLLRPRSAKKDWITRGLELLLGWFFGLFNWAFGTATNAYAWAVRRLLRLAAVVLLVYGGLLFLTVMGFKTVPVGFIPLQDQGYLIGLAQLPDGASLQRSDELGRQMVRLVADIPGVKAHARGGGLFRC
jgi:biotin carboxyl carrier protein